MIRKLLQAPKKTVAEFSQMPEKSKRGAVKGTFLVIKFHLLILLVEGCRVVQSTASSSHSTVYKCQIWYF